MVPKTPTYKKMKRPFFSSSVLVILSVLFACSWIQVQKDHIPKQITIKKPEETVTYSGKDSFYFKWKIEERLDSTRTEESGETKSISVRIVNWSDSYIWLESKSWFGLKSIPQDYTKERKIIFGRRKGDIRVGVPIDSLTELSVDISKKVPTKGKNSFWKFIIPGIFSGFAYAIEVLGDKEENLEKEDAIGLLSLGIIGAICGGVAYPIYESVRQEKKTFRKRYPLKGPKGYQFHLD